MRFFTPRSLHSFIFSMLFFFMIQTFWTLFVPMIRLDSFMCFSLSDFPRTLNNLDNLVIKAAGTRTQFKILLKAHFVSLLSDNNSFWLECSGIYLSLSHIAGRLAIKRIRLIFIYIKIFRIFKLCFCYTKNWHIGQLIRYGRQNFPSQRKLFYQIF